MLGFSEWCNSVIIFFPYFQYLESLFQLLFQLLQQVTECDTKMQVLHVLSCVIERVNVQVTITLAIVQIIIGILTGHMLHVLVLILMYYTNGTMHCIRVQLQTRSWFPCGVYFLGGGGFWCIMPVALSVEIKVKGLLTQILLVKTVLSHILLEEPSFGRFCLSNMNQYASVKSRCMCTFYPQWLQNWIFFFPVFYYILSYVNLTQTCWRFVLCRSNCGLIWYGLFLAWPWTSLVKDIIWNHEFSHRYRQTCTYQYIQ